MRDVAAALAQWWGLVRPGGHMVIVVPDEDLYEQGAWPSLFNPDHKATFNLRKKASWSPVSHDLEALVRGLPGALIIEACLQANNYDRRLMRVGVTPVRRLLIRLAAWRDRLLHGMMRRGIPVYRLNLALDRLERALGKPVDQTLGLAVAQIQVVARKVPAG
jgi:SAM-dependent methyltransferase